MNKKLVIICNSIDRLKLIDKYMFTDEFPGEIFIASDDRYLTVWKDIEQFTFSNNNLQRAKLILFKRDMLDYIIDKVQPGIYQDVLEKMLFSMTFLSNIYFSRTENDITFIIEDDIILFKNPESLMNDGLKACSMRNLPADNTMNNKLVQFFELMGDYAFDNIGIQKNDPNFGVLLDKKFGKLLGQASTIWTYVPDYPEYIRKWLYLPNTIKSTLLNRKRACKLYKDGFTFALEWLVDCFLLGHKVNLFNELEIVAQDRSKSIYKAKQIADREVYGYHYLIISDLYIQKWLPYLLENGYDKYKEATKGLEDTSRMGKYAYLNTELMDGWVISEPNLKARVEANKPKKVPFFLRKKGN